MYSDMPISLNYSIAEIQTIDKTNSAFSKTITVPGTKNNNDLLGHLFDVGVGNTYNVNVKAPCSIEVDSLEVMKGHMRIVNIRRTKKDFIEYDLEVQGVLAGMFNIISDAKLTDLDWSNLNMFFLEATVTNSWAAPIGVGYVFPMVDFGRESTHSIYNWSWMRPAIYLKEYIDRIFSFAGYTYDSYFFNSDFFKRLTVYSLTDSWSLTAEELTERRFRASIGAQYTEVMVQNTKYDVRINNDSTPPNTDPSGAFNTSTFIMSPPVPGVYEFTGSLTFDFPTFPASSAGYRIMFSVLYTFPGFPTPFNYDIDWIDVATSGTITCPIHFTNQFIVGTTAKLQVRFARIGPVGGNIDIRFATSGFIDFHSYTSQDFNLAGETVNLSKAVDKDVLIRDFLTSVVKMFNLYIDVDKDQSNKLLIEPQTDFYSSGRVIDWSDKLNRDEPMQISPQGGAIKEYNFKYSKDNDVWNEAYTKSYQRDYADRKVNVVTDFLKDKQTTEVIFAPTPCVQFMNSNRVLPAIYYSDNKGNTTKKPSKIRLLYFAGMKTSTPGFYLNSYGLQGSSSPSGAIQLQYPFFGMVDDPTTPTLSLDWGVPREIYWETLSYTNNNLYNRFYQQFLEEVFSKDGRVVSGKFYLTPADIATLDFRNKIYLDGINYKLNKIIDYDPVIPGLTTVELIKTINKVTFEQTQAVVQGGGGTPFSATNPDGGVMADELMPVRDRIAQIQPDGNSFYSENAQRVSGTGNIVHPSASFVEVSGIGNFVGGGAQYVSLVNTSGTIIGAAAKNISVINSSGVIISDSLVNISVINSPARTITESNISYIGNSVLRTSSTTNEAEIITAKKVLTAAQWANSFTTPIVLAESPGALYGVQAIIAMASLDFNSIAFSNDGAFIFSQGLAAGASQLSTNGMSNAADLYSTLEGTVGGGVTNWLPNAALLFGSNANDVSGGNSPITIYYQYLKFKI